MARWRALLNAAKEHVSWQLRLHHHAPAIRTVQIITTMYRRNIPRIFGYYFSCFAVSHDRLRDKVEYVVRRSSRQDMKRPLL